MISDELVQKALLIADASPANNHYFFSGLKSPEWIPALRRAGRFKNPVQAQREGGGIRFPSWPESNYLTRMASLAPDLVREVIVEAKATDNERVHQDFVEAAITMPAQSSAEIADSETKWLRTTDRLYTLYPEKAGALAAHLANGGQVGPALKLMRVLLSLSPQVPTQEADGEQEESLRMPPEPIGKFDQWHYQAVLRNSVPEIAHAAPEETFKLISDLLEAALKIHGARQQISDEDYSWIWRPHIESENHPDLKEALVSSVCHTAVAMSDSPESTARVVDLLLSRRWRAFRRIAAFVANAKEVFAETLGRVLTDHAEYEEFPGRSPEFDQLLASKFSLLAEDDKGTIFAMIDSGPELTQYRRRRENENNPATEVELSELSDSWRLRWLRRIETALPADWQGRYDELAERFGRPSIEPQFMTSGGFVGPTSPKTEEEMHELGPEGLVAFLQSWRSDGSWNGPAPEGLGRSLTALLSSKPEVLADKALLLRGLDPTYIRSALQGFREAVKNGKPVNWDSLLGLAEWVVAQQREIPGRKVEIGDADPDWGWSRAEIVRLIHEGIGNNKTNGLPIAYKDRVWALIAAVLDDPDPYDDNGASYGKNSLIGSLSLNTTRGIALEAILDYGLWIRREHAPTLPKEAGILDELPQVRAALETQLREHSSASAWEVFGRRFPWLVMLDRDWASRNVEAIFAQEHDKLGQVAWANYALFCRPYSDVWPILVPEYRRAIDNIGKGFRAEHEDIDRHLAEHIANLYWLGWIELGSEDQLVHSFFKKAPPKTRSHLIYAIGRGLVAEQGAVAEPTIRRLKKLWEWRFSVVKESTADPEPIHFGDWFASGNFDLEWSMANLLAVLRVSKKVELDHLVAERLTKSVDSLPTESVQALGMMIEGDRDGWHIYGWQEQARIVLSAAWAKGGVAQAEARRVIDLLGSRGHYGFRDLLKS